MKNSWIIFGILDLLTVARASYGLATTDWRFMTYYPEILIFSLLPIPLIILLLLSGINHLRRKRSAIWLYFAKVPFGVATAYMSLSFILYFVNPYSSLGLYYAGVGVIIGFEIFRIVMSILMLRKARQESRETEKLSPTNPSNLE